MSKRAANVDFIDLFDMSERTKVITGLPAYSDIPATVTVFWSIEGYPYTENPGYSDIQLTVTLFGRPNTVTVSGEACSC